jgi:hypothetical protein
MGVYEPILIAPDRLKDRIAMQGLTVAATVLRAEAAAATDAGDTTSAAAFNMWNTAILNSINYPGRAVGRATLMTIRKA